LVPIAARSTRLRVFENGALRNIYGSNTVDITGDWRKLHIAGLHEFYSSPNIIRGLAAQ